MVPLRNPPPELVIVIGNVEDSPMKTEPKSSDSGVNSRRAGGSEIWMRAVFVDQHFLGPVLILNLNESAVEFLLS